MVKHVLLNLFKAEDFPDNTDMWRWQFGANLHNHYVEDHRVLKLNPLSPVRMDTILENLLSNAVKKMSI